MQTIKFTKANLPFGWLGNMCGNWSGVPLKINFDGKEWQSSENLFQALRFSDQSIQELIRAENGWNGKIVAKEQGHLMTITPLSEQDVKNMLLCVYLKLEQHPQISNLLFLLDENTKIIEDVSSRIGDRNASSLFWGAALIKNQFWFGLNVLGEIWMMFLNWFHSHKSDFYSNEKFNCSIEQLYNSVNFINLIKKINSYKK